MQHKGMHPFVCCPSFLKLVPPRQYAEIHMEIQIPENPLISVIIPVRDAGEFLPDCLQSLLFQNYKNIEIIAIDDFSTDNSWQVLKEFSKMDKRIKIFQNVKNYGLAITLNRCLKRAKGKFVAFMEARDSITANKLNKQFNFLKNNKKVVAVGTQCTYITEDNKRAGKSNFPAVHEHISQTPIHGISVLFEGIMVNRFRIPKDLLHFPTQHHQTVLYSDMALKLMQYGELANLPECLQYHRKHNSRLHSFTNHLTSLAKLWISSRLNHSDTPPIRSFFSNVFKASTS